MFNNKLTTSSEIIFLIFLILFAMLIISVLIIRLILFFWGNKCKINLNGKDFLKSLSLNYQIDNLTIIEKKFFWRPILFWNHKKPKTLIVVKNHLQAANLNSLFNISYQFNQIQDNKDKTNSYK
ncbi:hypothetical protein ESOMN_v1c02030 [Williamsoniiplasma somnilux]|uniref:Uncharacterized protein n=1 Tax=Williamsoniiplasma somnilux TaxID=215578 RepID=A0A2K8NXS2_9MOLU|nr:hypothetical protein [Williamsoniiplasma somnilux]ATZ18587.1 hypothetical protein ESOMN_v1c02030 [Williamsoniiplasma somnilux]